MTNCRTWGRKILSFLTAFTLVLGLAGPLHISAAEGGDALGTSQEAHTPESNPEQNGPQSNTPYALTYTVTADIRLDNAPYTTPVTVKLIDDSINYKSEKTSQNGTVTFDNVPDSDYFYFVVDWDPTTHTGFDSRYSGGYYFSSSAAQTLTVPLFSGETVSTKVTLNGQPKANVQVELITEHRAGVIYRAQSDANGIVTFTNVPDIYEEFCFFVEGQADSHAYYYGEEENLIFTIPSATYPEIKLTTGYTLKAQLTSNGAPIDWDSCLIELVKEMPTQGDRMAWTLTEIDPNLHIDSDGNIVVPGVVAGDYAFIMHASTIEWTEPFAFTGSSNIIRVDFNPNYVFPESDSRITGAGDRMLVGPGGSSTQNLSIASGGTYRLPLTVNDFQWSKAAPSKLTVAMLEREDLSVKRKIAKGSEAIDSVTLENTADGVDIVIKFATPGNNTNFDIVVYIAQRSSRTGLESDNITGTVKGTGVTVSPGGGGSSGGGGGGGGSSSGSSKGTSSNTVFNPAGTSGSSSSTTASTGTVVEKSWAVNQVKEAVKAPNASGQAVVRALNPSTISLDIMKEMVSTAGTAPVLVNADTLSTTGGVDVRLSFSPSTATKDINLHASTLSENAKKIQTRFEKHFSNKLMVISFAQKGEFGMPVQVAAKLSEGINTDNLHFYTYDSATNLYNRLNVSYTVDGNGFVQFSTSVGGEILIVDNALARK